MHHQLIEWLWRASWQASLLASVVLLVQWLFRKHLTPQWRYNLWLLVVIRFLLPSSVESTVSLFNVPWFDHPNPLPTQIAAGVNTEIIPTETMIPSTDLQPTLDVHNLSAEPALPVQPSPLPTDGAIGKSPWPWTHWLAWAWFGGVLVLAAYSLLLVARFTRRLRSARSIHDPALLALLEECKAQVGVHRRIAVMTTDAVPSPALYGVWRPCLLLPLDLPAALSREEMRFVFLHELAHVKRWDIAMNWVMTLLQIVYWFNPVVWLVCNRLRIDRELACDALVLGRTGAGQHQAYGQTILRLLERMTVRTPAPGLVGISEDKRQMEQRIHHIARFKAASRWSVLAVLLVLALAAVGLTDARSPSNAPPSLAAVEIKGAGTNSVKSPQIPVEKLSVTVNDAKIQNSLGDSKTTNTVNPELEKLSTRVFKVDTNWLPDVSNFMAGAVSESIVPLEKGTNISGNFIFNFFLTNGIIMEPPKAFFYSDTKHLLMVRATPEDLDKILDLFSEMNRIPPSFQLPNTNSPIHYKKIITPTNPQEFARLWGTETASLPNEQQGKAIVRTIRGQVSCQAFGDKWRDGKVNAVFKAGATIKTDKDGQIDLHLFKNGPFLRLDENSVLTIETLSYGFDQAENTVTLTVLKLSQGTMRGRAGEMSNDSIYEVQTPGAKMRVKGTGFETSISADGTLSVTSGLVLVKSGDRTWVCKEGETKTINNVNPPTSIEKTTNRTGRLINDSQLYPLKLIVPATGPAFNPFLLSTQLVLTTNVQWQQRRVVIRFPSKFDHLFSQQSPLDPISTRPLDLIDTSYQPDVKLENLK